MKIAGETHDLWRAIDHEGEVLDVYVTKTRDKVAALKFLRKAMKRYGSPKVIVIRGQNYYLWRAVDSEGEVLDFLMQRRRHTSAAAPFMSKA